MIVVAGGFGWWIGSSGSDEEAAGTEVTWTQPSARLVVDPFDLQWRFWGWYEAEVFASDDRVSGTSITGVLGDPDFEKGLYEITNDGGMWRGMFTGIYDGATYYGEVLLLGTDAYAGLQYRVYWEGDGIDFAGHGIIEPATWPRTLN